MAKRNTVEIILAARDQASQITRKAFEGVQSSASSAMSSIRSSAAVAATALATVSGIVGKIGINYNAMQEQSAIAWETILGSAEEAKSTLKELQVMGAKTPFEFEGLDKAAKLLNMAGFEGDKLFSTLTSVGDAVSAIGGGQEELEGVSMAIFQMASKGKVSAEEMNQLAERGIPAWQMMAESMGTTVPELMKMSEQGKLFAKDVLPELIDGMGNKFGGAMDKQSNTFNGLMSTLKDNFKMLTAEIMEPAFARIKEFLPPVISLVDRLKSSINDGGFSGVLHEFLPKDLAFLIEAGLNGIGTAFSTLKDTFTQNKDKVIGVFVSIRDGALNYINTLKSLFSGEGGVGESIGRMFETAKSIVMPILTDLIAFVKEQFGQIKQFWDENGAQIIQAVQNLWSVIATIFKTVAPVVLFILGTIFESIKGVISGALDIIMGLVKVFAGLFTGDFSKMWEGVKQLFFGAIEFLWNLINLMLVGRIIGSIKAFITSGVGLFKNFWTKAVEIFKNLDTHVWNIITGFVTKIVSRIQSLYSQGAQIFGTLRTFGASTFQAMWSTITNLAGKIYSSVIQKFTSLSSGAKNQFEGVWSAAKSIFNKVKSAITTPIESAKNLVKRAIDSIKGFFSNMKVKIPMPHFSVSTKTKKVAGVPVPIPDIDVDWYDKGGIFTGPQIIGVGEKRPEFVGALDDLKKIVRDVIREERPAQQQAQQGDAPQYAIINIDGRQAMLAQIQYFEEELERREQSNSREWGDYT